MPSPTQPLLRCDTYERLWCSNSATSASSASTAADPPPAPGSSSTLVLSGDLTVESLGRGGVDPWAPHRGLALWRPQPPAGYLSLGDVPVAGSAGAPSIAVAVLAVNSGLVAWPTRCALALNGSPFFRPPSPWLAS